MNLPDTKFICEYPPQMTNKTEYYGNRGINFYRDNVYTSLNILGSSSPSANSINFIANETSYNDTFTSDVTIWFIGFINIKKTSLYEFNLITNGNAELYISSDATSANKVIV